MACGCACHLALKLQKHMAPEAKARLTALPHRLRCSGSLPLVEMNSFSS